MGRTRNLLGVLTLALLTGCNAPDMQYRQQTVGKIAPNFKLSTLDGSEVELEKLRGKPVVLAFWGHG